MFALSKRTIDSSAAVLERIELATGCGRSAALGIGRHSRCTKLEKMAAVVRIPHSVGARSCRKIRFTNRKLHESEI
jgi:hypothetical protein